ncbi:MAG: sigma-70 family RNA polymerase sigma factor [Actinomycetota bacterium]|nr:sigma-70 family RNA polymerase sigma factor [Actinomycetota bacterium]
MAWSQLVRRFSALVRGIARSRGLNDADVADVSQVVWLRLAGHLDRLRDADRLAGWLVTTTRRECIRVLRQRDRATPTSDTDMLDGLQDTAEPVAAVARQERAAALWSLIQTLPDHQRRLLEMLMLDPQPTYKEISDVLEIPVGSIGPTRQRCLAVLRRKCISTGIEPLPA